MSFEGNEEEEVNFTSESLQNGEETIRGREDASENKRSAKAGNWSQPWLRTDAPGNFQRPGKAPGIPTDVAEAAWTTAVHISACSAKI